jgi:hypothetical protein
LCLAKQVLELGEDLLDGIEIRRILRQKQEPGSRLAEGAPHLFAAVAAQIIHGHGLAWA